MNVALLCHVIPYIVRKRVCFTRDFSLLIKVRFLYWTRAPCVCVHTALWKHVKTFFFIHFKTTLLTRPVGHEPTANERKTQHTFVRVGCICQVFVHTRTYNERHSPAKEICRHRTASLFCIYISFFRRELRINTFRTNKNTMQAERSSSILLSYINRIEHFSTNLTCDWRQM